MMIFGKPLSKYVAFAWLFLILIFATGVVRLALSLTGSPNSTARWFTMTGLAWIAVLYYSIRMRTSRFGSYKELLVVFVLLDWTAQLVAVAGIAIAIFTGVNNVFSAPEFAFGSDGKTWTHLGAHLLIGTTVGALVPWGVGSAIFTGAKKLTAPNG